MFTAHYGNALKAYRSVGVETIADSAPPEQLVLMLFNGARAAVAAANGHMQRNEVAAKCKAITSAIEIVDGGLKASLDLSVGGKLAQNLSDLYGYITQRLFHANLRNDLRALEEVAQLLEQLGGAWESIATKTPSTAATGRTASTTTATTTAAPATAPSSAPAAATHANVNRVSAAYGAL